MYIRNHENPELIIVLHHIITDGWSNNKLVHQLSYIYDCLIQGDLPTFKVTQYRNFSEWHNNYIGSYDFSKELDYWIKELKDFKPNKIIPTNEKDKIEIIEISFACLENSYWSQKNNFMRILII
ncbi:condensation domain-containing protein [Staphylococcus saprophyticus]